MLLEAAICDATGKRPDPHDGYPHGDANVSPDGFCAAGLYRCYDEQAAPQPAQPDRASNCCSVDRCERCGRLHEQKREAQVMTHRRQAAGLTSRWPSSDDIFLTRRRSLISELAAA